MTPPNYASILCTKIGQKKLNGSVSPQNLQKAPKTPIARPSITPILRMDQVSSIYNPGNDFFWREEGPCRARARTSPARPSLGVPPTRFRGFPVTALSQTRLNLQVYGTLGQPAWFAPVPWTGTSRSQVGVPPRISSFVRRQILVHSKKPPRGGRKWGGFTWWFVWATIRITRIGQNVQRGFSGKVI